ncbi:MAG: FKBP-type peptidyl-prolyl cis-trans isomerase [Spirosomataceae bacterium]
MNSKIVGVVAFVASALVACNQFKVTTTEDGDRLQVHEKGESGRLPKEGDLVTFDLVIKSPKDTVMKSTYLEGAPVTLKMQKMGFKGSFERALFHIGEGDSTTVLVSADSLYAQVQQPLPPDMPKGSDLKFIVKMKKIQTEKEMETEMNKKKADEGKIMADYVAKNMPKAEKTAEGLYFVTQKAGAGATPKTGESVVVKYTGKFMDGKVFDSSEGRDPITVPLGQQMVIPGWEVMLSKMTKGQKVTVLIPSELAYGAQGAGNVIPPYTPIVFDMEVMDIVTKK